MTPIDIDIHNCPFRLEELGKNYASTVVMIDEAYYVLHISKSSVTTYRVWNYILTKQEVIDHIHCFRNILIC